MGRWSDEVKMMLNVRLDPVATDTVPPKLGVAAAAVAPRRKFASPSTVAKVSL